MNTAELTQRLKAKFSPPEYAIFTNVANGTGLGVNRWADAVAMGIWPSRGLHLHGFEIKVSRSDWLRELKQPAKADSIFRYCDYWSIVVADETIVQTGELPEPWGLIVASERGLKIGKAAPKQNPEPISRLFLAALLRRVSEQSADTEALEKAKRAGREEAEATYKRIEKLNLDADKRELIEIRKKLAEFKDASGIEITRYTWNAGKIGEAVKALLNGPNIDDLKLLAEQASKISERANAALSALAKCG